MTNQTPNFDDMTTHPNHPFMQAEDTKYGIELEIVMPKENWPFPVGSHFHPTQVSIYPDGWKVGTDVSIQVPFRGLFDENDHLNNNTGIEYIGIEIVSPKLKGFDGIVQIVQVLDDLNERGAIVNHSTGLHIHVDGRELDQRDIKKITQMYKMYESVFFGVMGEKAVTRWQNNIFCKPSPDWIDGEENSDRRRALNLRNWHNFEQKKTVEFRLFAGELNPEKVITYLMMCVGLVVYARNCTRVHKFGKAPADLKDLCKKFVNNVLKSKCNQIVPDYTPNRGESLFQVLYDNVPNSTVSL